LEVRQAFWGRGDETYLDLELQLGRDGTVEKVAVLDSQPASFIAEAAFEVESSAYVKSWVFEPAKTTSGTAVAVKFRIRLWQSGVWGVQNPLQQDRYVPCHESRMGICGVDGLQSNSSMNLPVRPVTARACARSAPGRPAGYAGR
jgi:hypothetical protein